MTNSKASILAARLEERADIVIDQTNAELFRETAALIRTIDEGNRRWADIACVRWAPRGIGHNSGIPDLRTGDVFGRSRPDLSGFVGSVKEGELAVAIFGNNAFLDFRPSEPNWIQVKVSCDEGALGRLHDLVQANENLLTVDIVRKALEGAA